MLYNGAPTTQIYQGKAVYISTGDYTTDNVGSGIIQLSRVHGLDWNIAYPLQQPTYLNSAYESYLSYPAAASISVSYYNTNGQNEMWLGLAHLNASGILTWNLESQKTLYITTENAPGVDAIGATGYSQTKTVLGFAQGLISQYSISATVGSLIESQASLDFLTSYVYSGQSGNQIPAVNYQDGSQVTGKFTLPTASSQYTVNQPSGYISTGATNYTSAISASDMFLLFPAGTPYGVVFTGAQAIFLQSFSCTLNFPRLEYKNIGYTFPTARPVNWPISVDLTTESIVTQYQADQLQRLSCLTTGQSVSVIVKQPCSNAVLFSLQFDQLQIGSQNFGTSVGRNDSANIRWHGIMSNPFQTFFDPTVEYLYNLANTGAWGLTW